MINISTPFSLRREFLVEKITRLPLLKTIPETIIKCLIAVSLLVISVAGKAQTVLNTGDIAIVGVNSTNPDKFSFVILKNITTNTVINFTDNGFTADATARTGEGFLTFTAQTNYSAGSVFTWINGSGVASDWNSNNPTSFSFNASGDQLFAFTGATSNWATQTNITLLFGINYGTALSATSSASNTVQPIALTSNYFLNLPSSSASNNYFANGSSAISTVTISGSAPGLLSSFVDAAKWFTQSNAAGAATFPTFFITVQWPIDAFTSSTGGSVSPSGTTFVNNGFSQTYTITPDLGYIISTVLVDGSSIGAVNNYTFNNVIASHTISASFICTAPEISDQPLLTQTVCQNSSPVGLTVAASGDGLNYQWYADDDNSGFNGSSINGATNNTFIPPTGISGTFFYYCIISGECGTAQSNYSTVTVNPLLTWYQDADGDGFGNPENSIQACDAPAGYISNNSDCDDTKLLYIDVDGDGYGTGTPVACGVANNTDCNDNDVDVHSLITFYRDADGDGFGDPNIITSVCSSILPVGYVSDNSDCDDTELLYRDADGDGFGSGTPIACGVANNTDCNDNDVDVHSLITFYRDADGDGFGDPNVAASVCSSAPPSGYVSNNRDCKDDDPSVYAGASEICDGKDNDCNRLIDDNTAIITFYRDADNDGYGNASGTTVQSCSAPAGYVSNNDDCNDADPAIHPGAAEICDGKDNNCDERVDEGFDADGDGYTPCNGDCDDYDATVYPGAPELCDDKDNNCNGQIDEGVKTTSYRDADGDGYGDPAISTQACTKPAGYVTNNTDCDDTRTAVYPGAPELCDGLDNNCDGQIDENSGTTYYKDADGDGYGNPAISVTGCSKPSGYVSNNTDCNDANKNVYPGAAEICDGIDDDCDGLTDEDVTTTYYRDADGDGYGNLAISIKACNKPSGYVTSNTDCNDNSASVHPGAAEICGNGIDENCNGQTDEGCITTVKICAYSQSAYDNNSISCVPDGVSSSGQIMLNAVDAQPGDSTIFGLSTTGRFFTLRKSDIQNGYIYKLLPGNGTSKALKGYATYSKPATWVNVPLSSNGAIQNELLAQTITLFFNLKLSPQTAALPLNTNLSIRRLTLCTLQRSLIHVKFTTTTAVANCLQTKYGSLGITVTNLYKLANELLSNTNTCNLNYTDVNNAIKNVNELFNGCVLLNISSFNNNNNTPTDIVAVREKNLKEINSIEELHVTTAPNPFRDNVRFNVISPESGKLRILIYDVNGIKQGELEQEVIKNVPAILWFRNKQLRQGVLFYRISINKQISTGKIIQIK